MPCKILALLLSLCLLFSGCGAAAERASTEEPEAVPDPLEESTTTPEEVPEEPPEEPPVQPQSTTGIQLPDPVAVNHYGIDVSVQPVMELLSVVQYLSGYQEEYGLLTRYDLSYKEDVEAYFRPFASHEAVALFDGYFPNGYSFDKPPASMLYLNNDLSVNHGLLEGTSFQAQYLGFDFEGFVAAMQDFYLESAFEEFYLEHTDYYQLIVDNTVTQIPSWNMIDTMEEYYGFQMGSYNIVLVSLFHTGGYGPNVKREGATHIYSVQGPVGEEGGIPSFGSVEGFSELVLHEFGHSFVSINEAEELPEVQKAIADTEYLFGPIEEQMQRNAYGGWVSAYEELVLRTVVVRMMEQNQGSDPAELMEYEYDTGFIYIQDVYDCLDQYEEERSSYDNFDAFIPVISAYLTERNPQD